MSKMMKLLEANGTMDMIDTHVNAELAKIGSPNMEHALKNEVNKMTIELCRRMDKIYTDSELEGLIKFYESDVGKMMIAKAPQLMKISTEVMTTYMEKVQEITFGIIDEDDDQHLNNN